MYSFPVLEPVLCSMSNSNFCFLTCIQISQESKSIGTLQLAAVVVFVLQKSLQIRVFFFFSFLELVYQDRVCGRLSQCYSDPTALPIQVSPSRYGPFAFWTEAPGDWNPEQLMCPFQAVVGQEWPLRCRLLDSLLELGEELSLLYHTEL